MLKVIKYIGLICSLSLLTACGEFIDPLEMDVLSGVTISRKQADLMAGDTLILDAYLTPEHARGTFIWNVTEGDSNAVSLTGREVIGRSAGEVRINVKVTSWGQGDSVTVNRTFTDSCHVSVYDWSVPDSYTFPYETMLIAQLQIDQVDVTADLGELRVVATVDGKVRGVAQLRNDHGIPYLLFRIGSHHYGETAQLECYSKARYQLIRIGQLTLDGETHGSLSQRQQLQGQFLPQ